MNGTVIHIADGAGIIINEQGERYSFEAGDIKSGNVRNGSKVNFIVDENQAKRNLHLSRRKST